MATQGLCTVWRQLTQPAHKGGLQSRHKHASAMITLLFYNSCKVKARPAMGHLCKSHFPVLSLWLEKFILEPLQYAHYFSSLQFEDVNSECILSKWLAYGASTEYITVRILSYMGGLAWEAHSQPFNIHYSYRKSFQPHVYQWLERHPQLSWRWPVIEFCWHHWLLDWFLKSKWLQGAEAKAHVCPGENGPAGFNVHMTVVRPLSRIRGTGFGGG